MSTYSPNPKRLIMIVGDSRVGKSTVMRLLIDLYCSLGYRLRAYDHDNRKRLEPYKCLVGVESINFDEGTDWVIEELRNGYDTLAVDMPGQHIEGICNYIDKVNLFKTLGKVDWRLTFVQPISHRLDCVEYLSQLLAFAGNQADYVVVKNQHFAQRFKLYQTNGYPKLKDVDGCDIALSGLNKYSYEAIESIGLPYSQVRDNINIFSVYRAYAYRWLNSFYQSIESNSLASEYLGLLQIRQQQESGHDDF
ncbi:hypothetical protein NIES2109_62620 (plasmid) [Nostoc sp. HK-01]|nr:hypothetical protein NIES2109_62620 [Nostoc sp. HK-01]